MVAARAAGLAELPGPDRSRQADETGRALQVAAEPSRAFRCRVFPGTGFNFPPRSPSFSSREHLRLLLVSCPLLSELPRHPARHGSGAAPCPGRPSPQPSCQPRAHTAEASLSLSLPLPRLNLSADKRTLEKAFVTPRTPPARPVLLRVGVRGDFLEPPVPTPPVPSPPANSIPHTNSSTAVTAVLCVTRTPNCPVLMFLGP